MGSWWVGSVFWVGGCVGVWVGGWVDGGERAVTLEKHKTPVFCTPVRAATIPASGPISRGRPGSSRGQPENLVIFFFGLD